MNRIARLVKHVAFVLMAVVGLFGSLFVIGETFADPGGLTAVLVTAAWVVPLATLGTFAVTRPGAAAMVFVASTAAVIAFTVADSVLGIIPRDDWGPVAAVTVLALGVALAFLGLHRPALAGGLMVTAALGQLAATALAFATHETENGAGAGAVPGGSSTVVIVPLLVIGSLFLLSGLLGREAVSTAKPPHVRPAH